MDVGLSQSKEIRQSQKKVFLGIRLLVMTILLVFRFMSYCNVTSTSTKPRPDLNPVIALPMIAP